MAVAVVLLSSSLSTAVTKAHLWSELHSDAVLHPEPSVLKAIKFWWQTVASIQQNRPNRGFLFHRIDMQ